MNLSKVLKITVIGAAVLGGTVTLPWAFCASSVETYALFQCANRAYFEPVPGGFTKNDITGIFWQFGFGNMNVNTGLGTSGTAFASKAFNGNDSGMFPVDLLDAAATFPTEGFPPGSVCLGSNNWANSGVDGCCDNARPAAPFLYANAYNSFGTYSYPNDDNILNPYFGFFQNVAGFPGLYSLASIMDYPTAVLLRLPGDAYFAVAAVQNMDRDNTGELTGPCADPNFFTVGPNDAACDVRQGFYAYANVTNGHPNQTPASFGTPNAVPWQTARPREVSGLNCNVVDCGGTSVPVQFQVDPIMIHSDEGEVPTNNPTLATRNLAQPRDATRAAGVGVRDLKRKWGGMVRYQLESAPIVPGVNTDPNGNILYPTLTFAPSGSVVTPSLDANGNPTGPVMFPPTGTMTIPIPSCWRTRIDIGKTPEAVAVTEVNTRVGKLGDVGISIRQASVSGVTCFGNRDPLASENIINAAVRTVKGRHTITWDTTAEFTVQGFEIYAVTQRGPKLVGNVDCTECSNGAGASYETSVRPADVRGGKVTGFQVKMKGGSGAVAELPAR